MSNLVKFGGANLPSAQSLSQALRSIDTEVSSPMVILRMDKTGHWVFGADSTEVDKDTMWAINPYSFVHGYIAWGVGTVLGEKIAPIGDPLPELEPCPAGSELGWQKLVGMSLKCVSGEDKGLEARYSVTSVGGKRAVHELAMKVADQVDTSEKFVPVAKLGSSHYPHQKYGRVYVPVFDIVEWISIDGDGADDVAPPAESANTTRRRRS